LRIYARAVAAAQLLLKRLGPELGNVWLWPIAPSVAATGQKLPTEINQRILFLATAMRAAG
jgi:hypothetical protein